MTTDDAEWLAAVEGEAKKFLFTRPRGNEMILLLIAKIRRRDTEIELLTGERNAAIAFNRANAP